MPTEPLRICTAAEMRELDLAAESDYCIEPGILMENAGRGAAQILLERYPGAGQETEILVFAGKGNNAGDAFVVARRLLCLGRRVRVFHLQDSSFYSGAAGRNFQILKRLKAKLVQLDRIDELESFFKSSTGPFTVVDGLLGTGLKGEIDGVFYDVIQLINGVAREVVSLDIPSGVSGDSGRIHGTSVQATLTVSFGFPKLGHFLPPGAARRGDLVNLDISLPPKFRKEGEKFLLMPGPMSALIRERDRYGHKNSFGHTLLVGGSPGRIGAITMAARACHRMGTGLVTVATWKDALDPLLVKLPDETMAVPLHLTGPEAENYRRQLAGYSSIVAGPGLGLRPEGKQLLQEILGGYRGPVVLDADALNLVAEHRMHDLLLNRRAPTVLTPHPGEMARLLADDKEKVTESPVQAVRDLIARTCSVVVLKGAATLIGSGEGVLYLNHYPNDGMATAGSGDVLAGMIGGLLGQGMEPFQGTQLGVYLHSLAGDIAARANGHRSMTARDIIQGISGAFRELKCAKEPDVAGRAVLR